jgi:hypothetical protein
MASTASEYLRDFWNAIKARVYLDGSDFAVPVEIVSGAGSQLTPIITSTSANGTVAAGKRYVEFILSSDFTGTILGTAFAGPRDVAFELPLLPVGDSYTVIAYTVTAGSMRITSF